MKTKSTLFCLAFALFANISITVNAEVNQQDSLALVDLYNSTNGPNWNNHTNWLTKNPVSTWYGVTIKNKRVTQIVLPMNNLTGSLPSSLSDLISLNHLELQKNQLIGSIPSSLGNLTNLGFIELADNQLSGGIPSSFGNLTNLGFLELTNNNLSGRIPSSLGNLVNLVSLFLGENHFSGNIPSSLGNLKELAYLILRRNQLSGAIPSSIGNLTRLQNLQLQGNQLSGSIPSSLGNLTGLFWLYLSYNRLSGSIPSSLGNLKQLEYLELEDNQLSGSIPSSIGNFLYLHLDLSNNYLSGSIPSSFNNLSHLSNVNLRHNRFTFDGMELIAQTFPFAKYSPQANIPIHQNGNTLSVSAGGTLSNNTYKWFRCDGPGTPPVLVATIKGDSVFHPSESGRYRVKVLNSVATQLQLYSKLFDYTAPNSAVIASAQNSLQQNDKTNLFLVYPNPAKDILFVQTNSNASFSLLNQSGKILLTKNINGKGSINISGMAAGLYYLRNNSTEAVQKVIIAR